MSHGPWNAKSPSADITHRSKAQVEIPNYPKALTLSDRNKEKPAGKRAH